MVSNIPQSTISDWRRKNTNPAYDKILMLCDALDIVPYERLDVKYRGRLIGYMEALQESANYYHL